MQPKTGKPLRLFNPLSIWTELALKSGGAMLDAAQAVVARPKVPKVAVIPTEDAPPPKAARAKAARGKTARAKTPQAKAKKARKSASSRAKRRGR